MVWLGNATFALATPGRGGLSALVSCAGEVAAVDAGGIRQALVVGSTQPLTAPERLVAWSDNYFLVRDSGGAREIFPVALSIRRDRGRESWPVGSAKSIASFSVGPKTVWHFVLDRTGILSAFSELRTDAGPTSLAYRGKLIDLPTPYEPSDYWERVRVFGDGRGKMVSVFLGSHLGAVSIATLRRGRAGQMIWTSDWTRHLAQGYPLFEPVAHDRVIAVDGNGLVYAIDERGRDWRHRLPMAPVEVYGVPLTAVDSPVSMLYFLGGREGSEEPYDCLRWATDSDSDSAASCFSPLRVPPLALASELAASGFVPTVVASARALEMPDDVATMLKPSRPWMEVMRASRLAVEWAVTKKIHGTPAAVFTRGQIQGDEPARAREMTRAWMRRMALSEFASLVRMRPLAKFFRNRNLPLQGMVLALDLHPWGEEPLELSSPGEALRQIPPLWMEEFAAWLARPAADVMAHLMADRSPDDFDGDDDFTMMDELARALSRRYGYRIDPHHDWLELLKSEWTGKESQFELFYDLVISTLDRFDPTWEISHDNEKSLAQFLTLPGGP